MTFETQVVFFVKLRKIGDCMTTRRFAIDTTVATVGVRDNDSQTGRRHADLRWWGSGGDASGQYGR